MSEKMIVAFFKDEEEAQIMKGKQQAKGYQATLEKTEKVLLRAADVGGLNATLMDVDDEIWVVIARK